MSEHDKHNRNLKDKNSKNSKLTKQAKPDKKKTKIALISLACIVVVLGAVYAFKKPKDEVELGKIDYENFDPAPAETEKDPIDKMEEMPEKEIPKDTTVYDSNEKDQEAANKADFEEYPFSKFEKSNAKLLEDADADRYKTSFVSHFDALMNSFYQARAEHQKGITEDNLEKMIYFNSSSTEIIGDLVNNIFLNERNYKVAAEDIYLFKNDDLSYQTNRPAIIGIRNESTNEIDYYLQGLAIMTPDFEGFIPFKLISNQR